jgi:hypothetical protein
MPKLAIAPITEPWRAVPPSTATHTIKTVRAAVSAGPTLGDRMATAEGMNTRKVTSRVDALSVSGTVRNTPAVVITRRNHMISGT